MEQYILKAAVVAEIERRIKVLYKDRDFNYLQIKELEALLPFLDTLEVKEVDLDDEFDKYCSNLYLIDFENEPYAELFECAKHFFELGIKAQRGE